MLLEAYAADVWTEHRDHDKIVHALVAAPGMKLTPDDIAAVHPA